MTDTALMPKPQPERVVLRRAEPTGTGAGETPPDPRWAFPALAILLLVAIGFGGGGSKAAMANLVVQLTAIAALFFHRDAFAAFWRAAPISLRVLIALTVALPVLTIIPLPPGIWSALPGRDLVAQSLALVDGEAGAQAWRAASVDPARTLLAISALISPLTVLTIGWITPRERLGMLGWIVVALGVVNFVIGVPQVISEGAAGIIFPDSNMAGVLFGTFANRNSTGLFCVAALTLALLLPPPPKTERASLVLRTIICISLILTIVLTRSRTALVLAAIPLTVAGLRMILARRNVQGGKAWLVFAPIVLGVVAIGSVVAIAPGRFAETLERFDQAENPRAYIWEDALYSANRYWPAGSGTGTFDEVFQIDESLENMTVRRAGRAHNDYLEAAIENGIPGLVLIAAWLVFLAWFSWRARHSRTRWIAWSGSVILLTIALQSITDYPLRNQSMLVIGGLALLLLVRFGADKQEVAA